jgi:hypothetical protein
MDIDIDIDIDTDTDIDRESSASRPAPVHTRALTKPERALRSGRLIRGRAPTEYMKKTESGEGGCTRARAPAREGWRCVLYHVMYVIIYLGALLRARDRYWVGVWLRRQRERKVYGKIVRETDREGERERASK